MKYAKAVVKGAKSMVGWEGVGALLVIVLALAVVWRLVPAIAPDRFFSQTVGV